VFDVGKAAHTDVVIDQLIPAKAGTFFDVEILFDNRFDHASKVQLKHSLFLVQHPFLHLLTQK
jgi:hypothetical protein